jgi:hypothetical protein
VDDQRVTAVRTWTRVREPDSTTAASLNDRAGRTRDDLLRQQLPMEAGNQAVARYVAAERPAVTRAALLRRPMAAEQPAAAPGRAVLAPGDSSPTNVAAQLGEDYDLDHSPVPADATPPAAPAAGGLKTAMDRLEYSWMLGMFTTLQILRLNGSPRSPGSRRPLQWLVDNRDAAAPRTRIAITAIAAPSEVKAGDLAALPPDQACEVKAFLELKSWDDPVLGLPRGRSPGASAVTDKQRDQLAYIGRRRDFVADRGRAIFSNRRGLEYDGSPSKDPTPGGAAAGTLEAEIWKELDLEGSASSVNTYDNQKFTWGKGWSALSTLPAIVERFFTTDPGAKQELMEAGFTYRSAESVWLFVDLGAQAVLVGNAALDAFKADRKFVNLVTHLVEDPEHQQSMVNAQWAELSSGGRAGDVPAAVRSAWPATWPTESVRFAAHCVHWGYSWAQMAGVGADIKQLIGWISKKKGTHDPSGAWKITGMPSGTIRHFANGAAQRQMTGPAPLPSALDPTAFYFEAGTDFYVWKP